MSTFVWFLGSSASARRVGLLLDFVFWGLHFVSFGLKCHHIPPMCTDMQLEFRFDLAFIDLYGSLWILWLYRYEVTEPEQYPSSLSRFRSEILGELESGRDLGATGHHSGMLGLCWRPRLSYRSAEARYLTCASTCAMIGNVLIIASIVQDQETEFKSDNHPLRIGKNLHISYTALNKLNDQHI